MRDVYRKHRKLNNREFSDVMAALETHEITVTEGDSKKGRAFQFVVATGRKS